VGYGFGIHSPESRLNLGLTSSENDGGTAFVWDLGHGGLRVSLVRLFRMWVGFRGDLGRVRGGDGSGLGGF